MSHFPTKRSRTVNRKGGHENGVSFSFSPNRVDQVVEGRTKEKERHNVYSFLDQSFDLLHANGKPSMLCSMCNKKLQRGRLLLHSGDQLESFVKFHALKIHRGVRIAQLEQPITDTQTAVFRCSTSG